MGACRGSPRRFPDCPWPLALSLTTAEVDALAFDPLERRTGTRMVRPRDGDTCTRAIPGVDLAASMCAPRALRLLLATASTASTRLNLRGLPTVPKMLSSWLSSGVPSSSYPADKSCTPRNVGVSLSSRRRSGDVDGDLTGIVASSSLSSSSES